MGQKIAVVGGGLLVMAIGWWWLGQGRPAEMVEEVIEQMGGQEKETAHPLSVERLANREWRGGRIETVRKVSVSPRFESQVVQYQSEGLTQYALWNQPTGQVPDGGWPVVVVNHGYIPPDEYSTERSYINTSAYFANAGFAVVKPDYRGHDQSQGQAQNLISRIEYAVDVLNLVAALPSLPEVNPDRVYMYGHSMGGDVTLRVLEVSNLVKAATLWAPAVTGWPESGLYFARRNGDTERLARLKEEAASIPTDEWASMGTLENVERVKVPVVIHHGTADESVPFEWGEQLGLVLSEAGREVTFFGYSGDNHDIAGNWSRALARDVELFNRIK